MTSGWEGTNDCLIEGSEGNSKHKGDVDNQEAILRANDLLVRPVARVHVGIHFWAYHPVCHRNWEGGPAMRKKPKKKCWQLGRPGQKYLSCSSVLFMRHQESPRIL
jgi:hypothetical protein